jgi:hypothetical protein
MYKVGDKVKIAVENDNENYDGFREQILIVESVARGKEEHPGYDDSMEGMALYDLQTEDGKDIGFSLYEYELGGL